MTRYKPCDLNQGKFIAVSYADQILPGSFEHTLNELVENEFDLNVFEARYSNDHTGRLAYDPAILLKIVLYGYYNGSSRAASSSGAGRTRNWRKSRRRRRGRRARLSAGTEPWTHKRRTVKRPGGLLQGPGFAEW